MKKWSKKRIDKYNDIVAKWITNYHLDEWVVTIKFEETDKAEEKWMIILADTIADPVYLKATITFYPEILKTEKDNSNEYTENCIKHEVSHLLTSEISDIAHNRYATEDEIDNAIERLTQRISII